MMATRSRRIGDSTTKILRMINKRNVKFHDAVTRFLEDCERNNLDPENHLMTAAHSYIPVQPILTYGLNTSSDANVGTCRNISILELIVLLKKEPFYENQLVVNASRSFPERAAKFGELKVPLSGEIAKALNDDKGITHLYSHQADAINNLHNGHNVIVSTSTASGKSLIYQIPVLQLLERDMNARAILFLCPRLKNVKIYTFDGDTPMSTRPDIRNNASVIFTNFDMIHAAILPFAQQWKYFLSVMKYVVIDELHVYNGLFGAHCALIMRRLNRMCEQFGNTQIQFISCSATIGNPDLHVKNFMGVSDIRFISNDGSPCGRKEFMIWNPPLVDPLDPTQGRKSAVMQTALILEFLISKNVRTIVFCKVIMLSWLNSHNGISQTLGNNGAMIYAQARKVCEIVMSQIRMNLQRGQNTYLLEKVMSYRAGYTPQDRRRIEQQLFSGELIGVIATSALELGIDVGSLELTSVVSQSDAVLMLGVPWSISAMWQQSGRAGRRNRDSLSLLIADHNSFDQYYTQNPSDLFDTPIASINVDITNPLILEAHLQCAAAESPLKIPSDEHFFGGNLKQICSRSLMFDEEQRDTYVVVDVTDNLNIIIEEIEASRAIFTIYEGAIFIHQGITYIVEETNVDLRYAKVRILNGIDWTTKQRDYTYARFYYYVDHANAFL
ncbi:P-loop containing nucleoside triphosphate hydrolase protein [Jimgerdemannia flammicorona]|uniref:P-loop containing nucleoside triphosphate hydrolase protein n=1 Tax=Jimgerdemannia flammicorona TaxID=994334 RepID=A0A433D218_9FUNG|nr:P-loop containing nucleoside triphosphate hydrolase protein [Jimgerdemannia flammicorona]